MFFWKKYHIFLHSQPNYDASLIHNLLFVFCFCGMDITSFFICNWAPLDEMPLSITAKKLNLCCFFFRFLSLVTLAWRLRHSSPSEISWVRWGTCYLLLSLRNKEGVFPLNLGCTVTILTNSEQPEMMLCSSGPTFKRTKRFHFSFSWNICSWSPEPSCKQSDIPETVVFYGSPS